MKYFFLFLFSLIFCVRLEAQEVLENNASSIKWYKLQTPNFRILYPQGFEEQAQRMANTMETIRTPEQESLGGNTRKTSVILQNRSAQSNGFVSMVPRRSEFYAMPTQNYNFSGTNDWMDLLATHEFRHIVQFDVARRGFNSVFYYLFGPATFSAMAQTSTPQWFWEGDAVVTETAFTSSGRGRMPNFGLVFRTNILEGRTFNYHKQYLRSYKDFIPNHYVLGYHMVGYLRKKTEKADSWERVTKKTWSVPFIPFAFSNAIKKESGVYVSQLYEEMAENLRGEWKEDLDKLSLTEFTTIEHKKRHGYTNYNFPQVLSDGRILAMKEGIGNIEQFVTIKDGDEKVVFTPGIINESGMLSVSGSWVVWNEHSFHPRWRVQNYSIIKMYNVDTKELRLVTSKSRYAGAALSPDANQIVTVETTTNYETSLVLLNIYGSEMKKFLNPDNAFYSMARWSADGSDIVALKTTKEGRSIVNVNVQSGEETVLFDAGDENVGHPVLVGKLVYFNSGITGIDNIYAIDVQSKQRYQVTCSKYGAYNPCVGPDNSYIYYNEQTRDGFDVVKILLDPSVWRPMNQVEMASTSLADVMANQEGEDLTDQISTNEYPSKRYRKITGLFNPYSWGTVFDETFTNLDIGIASRDILSTTSIKAGYVFDIYERTGSWRAGLSYQGAFPILDVNFIYAKRSVDEGTIAYDKVVGTDTTFNVLDDLKFEWNEQTVEAGLRLPLLATNGRFHSQVEFSNYVGVTKVNEFRNSIDGGGRLFPVNYPQYFFRSYQDNGTLIYNHFGFSAYRLLKRSRRDINSRWGQVIFADVFNTPAGDFSGNQFSFYSSLYFPGLFRNHSIWGYWAYQSTTVSPVNLKTGNGLDNYIFSNRVPIPRGHSIGRYQKFYSMSLNYTLPLWYPDIAIGPLLNIQRIRGNAFFDYGFGSSVFPSIAFNQDFVSVGGELKVDFNVMRALPQLNMGIRYSYGLRPSVSKFEVLIGTINF